MNHSLPVKILFLFCLTTGLILIAGNSARSQTGALDLFPTPKENNFILSWSCDSYVPADYLGKALPTRGSRVKVVATPTKMLAQHPDTFYYRWLLDGDIMGWAYGVGKSTFEFTVGRWAGNDHEVESQILDAGENLLARNFITIPVVDPEIILAQPKTDYAVKETLWAQTGQNISLTAIPLFFHIKNSSEVNFEWQMDNELLVPKEQKDLNQVVVKVPKGELIQLLVKNLRLLATHKQDPLQQAVVNLMINIR